jgi:hypothetical protein
MSYFNTSIKIPNGNSLAFTDTTANNVIITSNTISNTYSLILPSSLGTIGQALGLSNIIGNQGFLVFNDSGIL